MLSDNSNHKEIKLTQEFGTYLKETKQYEELFEDENTAGSDPFDSLGLIGNKLILIEYKHKISPSQIFYEGSRGSSIEKKIGQVLHLIYNKENSNTYNSIKEHITNKTIPEIMIVLNHISKHSANKLEKLLVKRSTEWQFNYKVILWKDKEENIIIENKNNLTFDKLHTEIELPTFLNTAPKRAPKLTYDRICEQFREEQIEHLYSYLKVKLEKLNLEPTYNINNVNFKLKTGGNALVGIWPYKSNMKNGILITYDIQGLNNGFNRAFKTSDDLGLIRNTQKIGFLGFNSFLNSKEKIKLFTDRLKSS